MTVFRRSGYYIQRQALVRQPRRDAVRSAIRPRAAYSAPPLLIARRAAYAGLLTAARRAAYPAPLTAARRAAYPGTIIRTRSASYGCDEQLLAARRAAYTGDSSDRVLAARRAAYAGLLLVSRAASYGSVQRLLVARRAAYPGAVTLLAARRAAYAATDADRLLAARRAAYRAVGLSSTDHSYSASVRVGGTLCGVVSAEVWADEGSPYWQAGIELADPNDYARFARDAAFTLTLEGTEYALIVDGRNLSRTDYAPTATVSGISPAAALDAERADAISQTWSSPIMASDAVEEILGQSISWDLVDWLLPANRLSIIDEAPMAAARRIVAAAGGVIYSLADGSLATRALWPISPPSYSRETADIELASGNAFSVGEAPDVARPVDLVHIMDVETSYSDTLEWEVDEDDPKMGTLHVYPSPWRETISLRSTRGSGITLYGRQTVARYETETIEVQRGAASTQYPIWDITSITWLSESLGSFAYARGARNLAASTDGWSLVAVIYQTKSIDYRVRITDDDYEQAQILVEEAA